MKKFIDFTINDKLVSNDETREITFIISTEKLNRHGAIVKQEGWDIKNYKKNPVIYFNHYADTPPIGKATRVWLDTDKKRLMATIKFADMEENAEADTIFRLVKGGFLNCVSPGYFTNWDTIENKEDKKNGKHIVMHGPHELVEISIAGIPANVEALKQENYFQNALESGIVDNLEIESLINTYKDQVSETDDIQIDENIQETEENDDIKFAIMVDKLTADLKKEYDYDYIYDGLVESFKKDDSEHNDLLDKLCKALKD